MAGEEDQPTATTEIISFDDHETYVHLCGKTYHTSICEECPAETQVACLRGHIIEETILKPPEASMEEYLKFYHANVPVILRMFSIDKGSKNPLVI